jgi:hypothetical protein
MYAVQTAVFEIKVFFTVLFGPTNAGCHPGEREFFKKNIGGTSKFWASNG